MTAPLTEIGVTPELMRAAEQCKTWDFDEARKLVRRYEQSSFPDAVLFETGYGPSGLPHIGTFGEVARTSMVRLAFRVLTQNRIPTRLLCFSDDMDGLRKIPENVPDPDAMAEHLGMPLTRVPDPFGSEHHSFGAANNARLRAFLDRFGFDYEFASSTDYYTSGRFDVTLQAMLEAYDEVISVILPTLGPERRETYSPFLPISRITGKVLQVRIEEVYPERGVIVYREPETAELVETTVTGGRVKCQWKADWALRWAALGVDYEMAGKDLIDSVKLSSKICRVLGKQPPEGFNYELFLDENGQKISKSKGNGLAMDEWLTYAPTESLSLYMFQKPKSAKRLHFDVIPRQVDEYFQHLAAYPQQTVEQQLQNPVWHVHEGSPPEIEMPVSFAMLLNLVSASNAHDKAVLWGFINSYSSAITPQTHPKLDELVGYAIRYFEDFVKPHKSFHAPVGDEREALLDLDTRLAALDADADAETIQNQIFAVGRERGFENLRDWFNFLYRCLLGQERGPRFGTFVALYGIRPTRELIAKALDGRLSSVQA
jgi:lysyl-tRNA synthetase, class I